MHFQTLWESKSQNKTSGISKSALSKNLGLRLAEQNVGHLKSVTFVLALNKAHVQALNTVHVLRLNKADVLALNKAHALRLNTKTCPVFTASAKESTKGGRAKAAALCGGGRRPSPLFWL